MEMSQLWVKARKREDESEVHQAQEIEGTRYWKPPMFIKATSLVLMT
jgi:hypothetical protein